MFAWHPSGIYNLLEEIHFQYLTYYQEGEAISSIVFSNYADGLDLGEILATGP